jgi:hypothetical protein
MKPFKPARTLAQPAHVRDDVWQQHIAWFEVITESLNQNRKRREGQSLNRVKGHSLN